MSTWVKKLNQYLQSTFTWGLFFLYTGTNTILKECVHFATSPLTPLLLAAMQVKMSAGAMSKKAGNGDECVKHRTTNQEKVFVWKQK